MRREWELQEGRTSEPTHRDKDNWKEGCPRRTRNWGSSPRPPLHRAAHPQQCSSHPLRHPFMYLRLTEASSCPRKWGRPRTPTQDKKEEVWRGDSLSHHTFPRDLPLSLLSFQSRPSRRSSNSSLWPLTVQGVPAPRPRLPHPLAPGESLPIRLGILQSVLGDSDSGPQTWAQKAVTCPPRGAAL